MDIWLTKRLFSCTQYWNVGMFLSIWRGGAAVDHTEIKSIILQVIICNLLLNYSFVCFPEARDFKSLSSKILTLNTFFKLCHVIKENLLLWGSLIYKTCIQTTQKIFFQSCWNIYINTHAFDNQSWVELLV